MDVTEEKSVFISYCSKDERYIRKMTQMLDKMGISYWIAPDMIPAGSNYAREIPGAIQCCEVFLLVLSKNSQQSIWVEKEIDSAINYRKTIVPFQIDDEPLTDMFRFYLNNVQTIYCVNRPKDAIEELKQRLRSLIRGAGENWEQVEVSRKEDTFESSNKASAEGVALDQKKDMSEGVALDQKKDMSEGAAPDQEKDTSEGEDASATEKTAVRNKVTRNRREKFMRSSGIPVECQYCGGKLEIISKGIYRCKECGRENYDYLRKVQNFLRLNGAKSAIVIERETGVPRSFIEQFLAQEFLEIPKLEPNRISCVKCGAPIRTGTLCEICKRKEKKQFREPVGHWRSHRR